jgi:hypothetical protein
MLQRFDAASARQVSSFLPKNRTKLQENHHCSANVSHSMKNNINISPRTEPSTQAAAFSLRVHVKGSLPRLENGQEPITSYNQGV